MGPMSFRSSVPDLTPNCFSRSVTMSVSCPMLLIFPTSLITICDGSLMLSQILYTDKVPSSPARASPLLGAMFWRSRACPSMPLGAIPFPLRSRCTCCMSFLASRLLVILRSFLTSSSVMLSSSSPSTDDCRNPSLNSSSPMVSAQYITSCADQSTGDTAFSRHARSASERCCSPFCTSRWAFLAEPPTMTAPSPPQKMMKRQAQSAPVTLTKRRGSWNCTCFFSLPTIFQLAASPS
mmetsp:Transcript_9980/g.24642  ORF Transcript_9980/g.24642 Transcript_9980/m.24642 type:complete len:237 (-) Transcript_9980:360-1070(-)